MKDYYKQNCRTCPHRENAVCNKYDEYIGYVTIMRCKKEREDAKPGK